MPTEGDFTWPDIEIAGAGHGDGARPLRPPNTRGAVGLTPPPLDLLLPGGGDGCRVKARLGGDRSRPVPWFGPPAGATDASGTSHFVQALCRSSLIAQALPSRTATNLVPSPP